MDLSVGEGLNDDNPSRQMTICGGSPRRARRMANETTTAVMLPVIECTVIAASFQAPKRPKLSW